MRKQSNFLPIAIVCLIIGAFLYIMPNSFLATASRTLLGFVARPLPRVFIFKNAESEIEKVKNENKDLVMQMAKFKNQEAENKALLDQFKTTYPKSVGLLPARIVGAPSFVPGITKAEVIIIDKGEKEGIKKGQAVVVKEHLVGIVGQVGTYGSQVLAITHPEITLKVKTTGFALGLLKGQGNGHMSIENVVLSENLSAGDIVITFGDLSENGHGVPPDLVVGTISTVDKKPSNVFQAAQIQSSIELSNLEMVFVVMENNQ